MKSIKAAELRRLCHMHEEGLLEPWDLPRLRKRKRVRVRAPDDLLTKHEAAARLRCSIKTLDAHVASGALRYVEVGRGSKRSRKMFAPADLTTFIEAQTRKEIPCLSPATHARRSTATISGSTVLAFTGQPKPRPNAKLNP